MKIYILVKNYFNRFKILFFGFFKIIFIFKTNKFLYLVKLIHLFFKIY